MRAAQRLIGAPPALFFLDAPNPRSGCAETDNHWDMSGPNHQPPRAVSDDNILHGISALGQASTLNILYAALRSDRPPMAERSVLFLIVYAAFQGRSGA